MRVGAAAVNTQVTLQIYDPAFVESGDTCDVGPYEQTSPDAVYPAGSRRRNDMNTYERTTGTQRYASSPNTFCAGDVLTAEGNEAAVTSFALRSPTDTYRPVNGTPVTGCVKQYKGYRSDKTPDDDRDGKDGSDSGTAISLAEAGTDPLFVTTSRLRQTLDNGTANPLYNAELAQVFHQWVNFCTFTPTSAGDYYLQVRTNVKLPVSPLPDGYGGYKNNANVYTQLGDDNTVKGNGNNRFALRVTGAQRGSVSIAGWDHMSIYANYPGGTSMFNLVRVIPAAASKSLLISFFDVGDATSAGTITVLPPLDSNMTAPLTGCTGGGVRNGALQWLCADQCELRQWLERQEPDDPGADPQHLYLQQHPGWRLLVPAPGLLPRDSQRHHHLVGARRRRPGPPDRVAAGSGRTAQPWWAGRCPAG